MKSVITKLEIVEDEISLAVTPYAVELKGQAQPTVKVRKVQNLAKGGYVVTVAAPTGLLALSTMDAIARRVEATASLVTNGKGPNVHMRTYKI